MYMYLRQVLPYRNLVSIGKSNPAVTWKKDCLNAVLKTLRMESGQYTHRVEIYDVCTAAFGHGSRNKEVTLIVASFDCTSRMRKS